MYAFEEYAVEIDQSNITESITFDNHPEEECADASRRGDLSF